MKNILIIAKHRRDSNPEPYSRLRMVALKDTKSAREVLETAFLLTGPKSFEIAISCAQIAHQENLQLAFFEIESDLFDQSNVSNQPDQ